MADVKVNIPGIGEVVATNAASEETLNKILEVMSKTTKAKDPAEGIFKTMVKDYRDQKKAADDFAAKVAPMVLEMQQRAGMTLRAVAAKLTQDGIKTAKGGVWTAMTVHNVLARSRRG